MYTTFFVFPLNGECFQANACNDEGLIFLSLNTKAVFFCEFNFKKLELEENIKYHDTEHKS